jgi:hypothetical protein
MKTKIILAMLSLFFMDSYTNQQVSNLEELCKSQDGTVIDVKACMLIGDPPLLPNYITTMYSEESCTSKGGKIIDAKACQLFNGGPITALVEIEEYNIQEEQFKL